MLINHMFSQMHRIALSASLLLSLFGIVTTAVADVDGDAPNTTYTYNYNLNIPTGSYEGGAVTISLTGISDQGVIIGNFNDNSNTYGFVGTTIIAYPNQQQTEYSSNVTGINSSGKIIGTTQLTGYPTASPWFYSTTANYSTAAPTNVIIEAANTAAQNFAGITDSGLVVGSAAPNAGEGYTYLFTYNPTTQAYSKIDLAFLAAYACGATQGQLQVQVTAVSSDGNWVAGNYQNNNGTYGNFGYYLPTQAFITFNKNSSTSNVSTVATGINTSGVAVGYQTNTNGTTGFAYNVATQQSVNSKIIDPNANGGTFITGINDHGVLVGNSLGLNNALPNTPNYVFTATPK